MSAQCPVCGAGQIVRDSLQEEFEHEGVTLCATRIEEYCDACGTLLQTPAIVRENARNRQRAKLAHDGLLCGEEIRAFRESLAMTQKLAAELFGGGASAFAKYEADEIAHNLAMDRLLRLCRANPENVLLLAKESGVSLPSEVQAPITRRQRSREAVQQPAGS